MSYADKIFVNMCRDILDNGTDTKGEKVRAKWDDGSFAYTIKKIMSFVITLSFYFTTIL